MAALSAVSFGTDNWLLHLKPLTRHGLIVGGSDGMVRITDWSRLQDVVTEFKVAETAINGMEVVNHDFASASTFLTATQNSVKLFDVRAGSQEAASTFCNERRVPFLSVESRHNMVACGTELMGSDAELHIFDLRKPDHPLRTLRDSHHDDITSIKFHPWDQNLLMSGSTDDYTNIYDLKEQDEDDCLHQVINYASIHSCNWLSARRIYTLSHMETFAIHELNDRSEEFHEPQPLDFGDVREKWGCDYVVDIYPGYIATGKTDEGKSELKLIPFENERVALDNSVVISKAHGDEVVRDVLFFDNIFFSCGEDGFLRSWKVPIDRFNNSKNLSLEFLPKLKRDVDSFDGLKSPQEVAQSTLKIKKHKHTSKPKKQRYKPY